MYLKILATPGARKELVEEVASDTWRVSVRQPPSRNLANIRIRQIVAERLGVPFTQVRILTGHRGRSKIISVTNQ